MLDLETVNLDVSLGETQTMETRTRTFNLKFFKASVTCEKSYLNKLNESERR